MVIGHSENNLLAGQDTGAGHVLVYVAHGFEVLGILEELLLDHIGVQGDDQARQAEDVEVEVVGGVVVHP